MKIGIDASRALLKNRTGIEEYSYQTIKHLTEYLKNHQVILYIQKNQKVDFEFPENWQIKVIRWPRFWTQMGLSLEMFFYPIDVLFVPAHVVPFIHPQKTIVTIHGLEYEFIKNGYSLWERFYMRWSIKLSCLWASKIISVSQNTKKDLINLYKVDENKIKVIYEGYINNNLASIEQQSINDKYLLFIGRIEQRKNIINNIKAFEILKEKYNISHKLILAGKPGFGYEKIKSQIQNSKFQKDIIELGFVAEGQKWQLLKNADVFVFPTLYEGFGIPILEAQSVGCPVVASNNSSIPEVIGKAETHCNVSLQLVDPHDPASIAENIYKILSDNALKNAIIQKGLENVKRFSWEKCAREIVQLIK